MGEETGTSKNPEMTPQEDGTKVLLANDDPVNVEEAKYVSNPNGDAKIDVEVPPTFSGLTKDELMKYSNDPFWVRLRWFLFVLFWAGWLAMLIMAIIIIIQAPGCKPPPELLWVEEQPMVEVDPMNLPSAIDLINKCGALGISSVYLPNLMSMSNYQEANYDAKLLIDAVVNSERKVVTDLPSKIESRNAFFANATYQNLTNPDGTFNYANEDLAAAVYKEIVEVWISKGVKGFLMNSAETPEEKEFKDRLNALALESGGAIGSDIVDVKDEYIETPSLFKTFLEDRSSNWSFLMMNAVADGSKISEDYLRLVTLGMFLSPGTPILLHYDQMGNSSAELVSALVPMKLLKGIKFGTSNFVNTTSDDVVAFTRVYKGTPAYAIALNFNENNATVNFHGTPNVGDKGTLEIHSNHTTTSLKSKDKYDLDNVYLGAYEGVVLQFVATF